MGSFRGENSSDDPSRIHSSEEEPPANPDSYFYLDRTTGAFTFQGPDGVKTKLPLGTKITLGQKGLTLTVAERWNATGNVLIDGEKLPPRQIVLQDELGRPVYIFSPDDPPTD